VARDLDLDELLDAFTLTADELRLLRNKSGATRLGFALTLRFLLWRGRFPRGRGEVPDNAVVHVARQVKVEPSEIAFYDWQGRSAKRNRTEIREFTGFGECSVPDAEKVTLWLAENVCDQERNPDRVRQRLLEHCKEELIEPPEKTRIERIVRSALSQAEDQMMARAVGEVPAEVVERMLTLIGQASDDPDEAPADGGGPRGVCADQGRPGQCQPQDADRGEDEAGSGARCRGAAPGLRAPPGHDGGRVAGPGRGRGSLAPARPPAPDQGVPAGSAAVLT